jgi:uncharacterized protein involved in exopolysaccharide biosynthesis
MLSSGSNDQAQHPQQPRETALAPYCEVVLWRRRFYMALVAALFAVVALAVICTGRQ